MTRGQKTAAAAVGAQAAAVALARDPLTTALLAWPMVLAPLAWWLLRGARHWLAAFLAAAILLPPLPIPVGNAGPHIAPVFAAAGLAIGALRFREWRTTLDSLDRRLLLFLLILLASSGLAYWYSGPRIAAGSLARVALIAIAGYVFLYQRHGPVDYAPDLQRALRWLFAAGVIAAVFACVDFVYQLPAPAGYGAQFIWLDTGVFRRAQGLFYEASTLGNFCAFFLVMIAVAATDRTWKPLPWPVLIAAGCLFSAALVFSSSRASVINAAVALGALVYLKRAWRPLRRVAAIVLLSLAAGGAVTYLAFPEFARVYGMRMALSLQYLFTETNGILSGRVATWQALAAFLIESPECLFFGVGYKTLPYSDIAGRPIIVDNMYLSLLAETGLAGLAAFVALNGAILRTARRAALSALPQAAFFGAWIFCFWCGELVQMLSGDLLTYWRVLPVYLWVLATAARESAATHASSVS